MCKTKRQLRAEAAERLRNCYCTSDSDLVRAMLNWGYEPHTGDDSRFALVDLLTDDEPPEGDAVGIMREAAKGRTKDGKRIETECGTVIECARKLLVDGGAYEYALGGDAGVLQMLADMVERDYVRRDSIEEVMDNDRALAAENTRLAAVRDVLQGSLDIVMQNMSMLERERDEWQRTADDYQERKDELRFERDYWRHQFRRCLGVALNWEGEEGSFEKLMSYPRPDDVIEPFQLVTDEIHSLRDFLAEAYMERDRLHEGAEKVWCDCDCCKRQEQREGMAREVEALKAERKKLRRKAVCLSDSRDHWKARCGELEAERDEMAGEADRWEREARRWRRTAESLPVLASDGRPIEPGQVMRGLSDGKRWRVASVDRAAGKYPVEAAPFDDRAAPGKRLKPEWLVHAEPSLVEDVKEWIS